jgi:hypothetical protein
MCSAARTTFRSARHQVVGAHDPHELPVLHDWQPADFVLQHQTGRIFCHVARGDRNRIGRHRRVDFGRVKVTQVLA